jgi:ABC-type multidrug transport system ATPase subunit
MALMSAVGLGRRFGSQWVFRGVEIELSQGDALCVIGSNGSGKSTLLRILAGLLSATEGSVVRPTALGYSAIDLALWPQLTASEHLELAAALRGVAVSDGLRRVGLADAANKPVGQFSTGMRARLKLALAVQHSPEVLLLDEPSASLDDEGRSLIEGAVAEQLKRGAVVIATNDPGDRRHATHELELG